MPSETILNPQGFPRLPTLRVAFVHHESRGAPNRESTFSVPRDSAGLFRRAGGAILEVRCHTRVLNSLCVKFFKEALRGGFRDKRIIITGNVPA